MNAANLRLNRVLLVGVEGIAGVPLVANPSLNAALDPIPPLLHDLARAELGNACPNRTGTITLHTKREVHEIRRQIQPRYFGGVAN